MILGIFIGFFVVAFVIAIPQFILKEFGEISIRKSIIIRIIMSFVFFALFIFLLNFFDAKDQNVEFWDMLGKFFKDYSVVLKDFEFINIWEMLQKFEGNVVWVNIFLFFPQLTLLIPQFLFNKFKEYAEKTEVAVTERVEVSVNSYGDVSAREANIYNTVRPYLYKTVIAIIASVLIFIPILYGIIKYLSAIYAMIIILALDIIILVIACIKPKKK